jgi:hypothetical protein
MPPVLPEPVPKDLREQLMRSRDRFEESDLVLVHRVILEIEKQKLWKRMVTRQRQADRQAGKWGDLDDVIRDVRLKLHQATVPQSGRQVHRA